MIVHADVLEWAATYDGPPFHAMLCDPPYHLTAPRCYESFVTGAGGIRPTAEQNARRRAGFMGKAWDGGDIAFRAETWAALAAHLHPGAFIMAFAGSRGYHRMACAIEDAGFIIHPAICWLTGQGFPKATRIDTQIDAAAGAEREVVGKGINYDAKQRHSASHSGNGATYLPAPRGPLITAPATDLARAWAGHRYGLQALKPCVEFICVAQVPYKGRPVDSITATGAGALNIQAGRIGCTGGPAGAGPGPAGLIYGGNLNGARGEPVDGMGRWPANLCLDEAGAAVVDAQSGESAAGRFPANSGGIGTVSGIYGYAAGREQQERNLDTGGASRFFLVSDWAAEIEEQIAQADAAFYTAKAGRRERDAGLETMPLKNAGVMVGRNADARPNHAGLNGDGTFVQARNAHPTVKPLRLTRWLASLLLPPAEYAPRRILIPFAGAGSECVGAHLAGWDEITGVEISEEYCEIARARLAFWQGNVGLFESLTAEDETEDAQGSLELL